MQTTDWTKYINNFPKEETFVKVKASPELLKWLLSLNDPACNRNSSEARIRIVESQALRNRWCITNQAIGIRTDGKLGDGAHRVKGLLRAFAINPTLNISLILMFGLEPEAQRVIDVGRSRKVAETLKMDGLSYTKEHTSYLGMCIRLYAGTYLPITTSDDYHDWHKFFGRSIEWAIETFGSSKPFRNAHIAGPLAFAYKTDPSKINEFGIAIRDGEGLTSAEPAWVLRERIIQMSKLPRGKDSLGELAEPVLYAAMKHVQGDTIRCVKQGDAPVKFFGHAWYNDSGLRRFASLYSPEVEQTLDNRIAEAMKSKKKK